ncbi:MAG TPA: hypothetical protein VD905_05260 [Flavobacteriales bacterium]|nr:hypothetical protein [Flavobacteriales bacterium]
MKRISLFSCVILCLGLLGMGLLQKPYKSVAGKFSVLFPKPPTEGSQDVPTDVGNIKMYSFMAEVSDAKVFMVAYSDYDEKLMEAAEPYTVLRGSRDGVVTQFQAEIDSEKESKFEGYPCIDFVASGDTYFTSYKLILVKNRLYQIGILKIGSAVSKADQAFISSFKLTK